MVGLTGHMPLQFGRALLRILRKIVASDPTFGPIFIIKLDLAKGFYQIHLAPRHIPALGVTFPTQQGHPPLIAFPLALPMGWTSSPPLFCTATETVADLTNHTLHMNQPMLPHHLELEANPLPTDAHMLATTPAETLPMSQDCTISTHQPLAWSNVFVDDHVALAQGSPMHLQQVRHTLLHSIDKVFCPLETTDCPTCQEPVSQKSWPQVMANGQPSALLG